MTETEKRAISRQKNRKQRANSEIRRYMAGRGVKQWEVAAKLGVAEATLVRWLRAPLDAEHEAKIREAVDSLAEAI